MHDDYLAERIAYALQRADFLHPLLLMRYGKSGLDVDALAAADDDEVHLQMLALQLRAIVILSRLNDTDVHAAVADAQLVVEEVLHDVAGILLAQPKPDIPQADILEIVFLQGIDVLLPLDVVPTCGADKKRLPEVFEIEAERLGVELLVLHTGEGADQL